MSESVGSLGVSVIRMHVGVTAGHIPTLEVSAGSGVLSGVRFSLWGQCGVRGSLSSQVLSGGQRGVKFCLSGSTTSVQFPALFITDPQKLFSSSVESIQETGTP
ncbi:hypothetical protein FKM82_028472 [Ascaphus truei]